MKNEAEQCPQPPNGAKTADDTGQHRREFLSGGSAALLSAAVTLGRVEAQDIDKVTKAEHDKSQSDAGPENKSLKDVNPNTFRRRQIMARYRPSGTRSHPRIGESRRADGRGKSRSRISRSPKTLLA